MTNRITWLLIALMVALALAACSQGDPGAEASASPEPIHLSPTQRLLRISMALRGTRPSLDEYRAVDADAAALDAIVDDYLESEDFGATMRDLHNESLLVRASIRPDLFGFGATTACPAGCPEQCYPPDCQLANCPISCRMADDFTPQDELLSQRDTHEITLAVHEAPLRFVEHVVMNDLPYSEILTADYTMANDLVAAVWGIGDHDGSPAWQAVHWPDARPAAGLLSDPVLFNRHKSTMSNENRGRANMISRAFLCYDFASREVEVSGVDQSDDNAVANALQTNDACVSCHQALDPLASAFYGHLGFVLSFQVPGYPVTFGGTPNFYASQQEGAWKNTTGRAPAFFGIPVTGLQDLGQKIVADSRFSLCAAQRFYAFFHRIGVDEVPLEQAAELQHAFIASGFNARQLAREIVLGDEFAELSSADETRGLKLATPDQLRRFFADTTGFRWELDSSFGQDERDLVTDPTFGFGVLAGGIDSYFTTLYAAAPNATSTLFMRALSAEAAVDLVTHDLIDGNAPLLLGAVGFDESAPDAIKRQLVDVHLRLYGEVLDIDDPEIAASHHVFEDSFARYGDPGRAWITTLTAMLQDTRVVFY